MQVIKLISQVIADFASGEISQQEYQYDTELSLQQYLDKSFYKTATLIAASCKSAAAFSGVSVEVRLQGLCMPVLHDFCRQGTAPARILLGNASHGLASQAAC